jgi:hypothetical protein
MAEVGRGQARIREIAPLRNAVAKVGGFQIGAEQVRAP